MSVIRHASSSRKVKTSSLETLSVIDWFGIIKQNYYLTCLRRSIRTYTCRLRGPLSDYFWLVAEGGFLKRLLATLIKAGQLWQFKLQQQRHQQRTQQTLGYFFLSPLCQLAKVPTWVDKPQKPSRITLPKVKRCCFEKTFNLFSATSWLASLPSLGWLAANKSDLELQDRTVETTIKWPLPKRQHSNSHAATTFLKQHLFHIENNKLTIASIWNWTFRDSTLGSVSDLCQISWESSGYSRNPHIASSLGPMYQREPFCYFPSNHRYNP